MVKKIENSTGKLVRLQRDLKRHQESLINSPISDEMLKTSHDFKAMQKIKGEIEVLLETASFS